MNPIWYVVIITSIVLIFLSLIIGAISMKKINEISERYSSVTTTCGVNGEDLSKILLSKAELTDVEINKIDSETSDMYNSKYKVLKITSDSSASNSVITLSKLAQEVGCAIQDRQNSKLFKIKTKFFPIIKILTRFFFPLLFVGMLIGFSFGFQTVGLCISVASIILLAICVIFYFITFTIENKSSALIGEVLDSCDFFTDRELYAIKDISYVFVWRYLLNLSTSLLFFLDFFSINKWMNTNNK